MSAEEENLNLEQRLRGISPPGANVNRDRLMFAAGAAAERAAVSRRVQRWRAVAGMCAATAAVLALFVALRPPRETTVVVRQPALSEPAVIVPPAEDQHPANVSPAAMLQLREAILRGEWHDSSASGADDAPSLQPQPTSLPRFDLKQVSGEAFPEDGRM